MRAGCLDRYRSFGVASRGEGSAHDKSVSTDTALLSRKTVHVNTYLRSLLGTPGFPLRERRRRGFLSFRRLSLRKEKYQHNCSDHTFLLTLRRLIRRTISSQCHHQLREDCVVSHCLRRSQQRARNDNAKLNVEFSGRRNIVLLSSVAFYRRAQCAGRMAAKGGYLAYHCSLEDRVIDLGEKGSRFVREREREGRSLR